MIDDFLTDLFGGDDAPASFDQRFGTLGPNANAPAGDIADLLQKGGTFTPTPGMLSPPPPRQPPVNPSLMPQTSTDLSARSAVPSPTVPLPTPRPDITSILAGQNGSVGNPSAMAPTGAATTPADTGIMARLAGLFAQNPNAPTTPTYQNPQSAPANSVLGRLAGINQGADTRIRAALAGGMAGGNPAFAGGALMKGLSGGMGGSLSAEQKDRNVNLAAQAQARQQANFDRQQTEKEKTDASLRKYYEGRANYYGSGGARSQAYNKPASERWKDANRLIIDKQKQLYGSINPLAPKADRDAQKAAADKELAQFKGDTYKQYGFSPDGMDAAPQTGPRPGGPIPSSAKVVGDKEAVDRGLYDNPDAKHAGTYDDPATPMTQDDFDSLPSGAIFVNPADGQTMSKR